MKVRGGRCAKLDGRKVRGQKKILDLKMSKNVTVSDKSEGRKELGDW